MDNHGFVIGPLSVQPVNQHDSVILPETVENLLAFTTRIGLDLEGSALTLDSGFDCKENRDIVKTNGLVPLIYPNRRNAKEPIVIARKFRWFNREGYRERYKVERTFAWQDTYRKLVISYDRLKETCLRATHRQARKGFRLLAYSMINFRVTFNHR